MDADEMTRIFGLIGVPSSAGAHYPGQEKAPAALRRAGLATRLAGVGISIVEKIVSAQQTPLVIGGDCTITIGVVAALVGSQPELAWMAD